MNMILLREEDFRFGSSRFEIRGRRFEHWRKVLRGRESARFGVLNGMIGTGALVKSDAESAEFEFQALRPPPPPFPVTVVMALPRPQTLKKSILSAVGFGVKRLIYIGTRKVEKSYWDSPLLERPRLDMEITLALEQAVDTLWPEVEFAPDLRRFMAEEFPALAAGRMCLIAHPGGEDAAVFPLPAEEGTVVILGPEGGFTPGEVELFEARGARQVNLGPRILRTEIALSALLGLLTVRG